MHVGGTVVGAGGMVVVTGGRVVGAGGVVVVTGGRVVGAGGVVVATGGTVVGAGEVGVSASGIEVPTVVLVDSSGACNALRSTTSCGSGDDDEAVIGPATSTPAATAIEAVTARTFMQSRFVGNRHIDLAGINLDMS